MLTCRLAATCGTPDETEVMEWNRAAWASFSVHSDKTEDIAAMRSLFGESVGYYDFFEQVLEFES